jgi:hypothetical protein
MPGHKLVATLVIGFWTWRALAVPYNHTDSLVNAALNNGTFREPSVLVRPRFRYWVPDASVDHEVLASDITEAKTAGAGGVEVLGYFLYGGMYLRPIS